jgi:hypothetical protein
MQRSPSSNNTRFTKTKDINPFRPKQVLNEIFLLLQQSHAAVKQFLTKSGSDNSKRENLCRHELYAVNGSLQQAWSVLAVLAMVLISVIFPATATAQPEEIDPMPVKVKGLVLSLEDEVPVPNAIIMNMRTKVTISADLQGRFTMDVLNIDSLEISSLGFSKSIARIPANYNEMNVLIIYAKPIRFSLPDVNVKGEQRKVNLDGVPVAKENKIAPELRGDAYNKKPPVIAAISAPASVLQYYLSKSEREKRETRKAIVTEREWERVSQIYNKQLVMELTGLNNAEADYFMIYINAKGLLSEIRTEYDARNIIKEQFKLYQQQGH